MALLLLITQTYGQQPGKAIWRVPIGLPNYFHNSSPAIGADGTIYVGSLQSNLYAISAVGTTNWIFPTGGPIGASPAVGPDDTVYVASYDGNLYAVGQGGTTNWWFTGGPFRASPALGVDGTVYVNSISNSVDRLYALFPDGTPRWTYVMGRVTASSESVQASSPAIGSDRTIYVGSRTTNLYAINPDGSTKWIFKLEALTYSSPAIGPDGTIYIGADDGKLYAIDRRGFQKWKFAVGGYIESSPAVTTKGDICAGSIYNSFYSLSSDGVPHWRAGASVSSSPAITSDGTAYIGDYTADALCRITPDGTYSLVDWGVDSVWSSPAIGPTGTIYYVSGNGMLSALYGTNELQHSAWPMFRHDPKHTARSTQRAIQLQNVLADGSCVLSLTVETGLTYRVESSTNLLDWNEQCTLVPTNFAIQVVDPTATNSPYQFYRLVAP